MQTHKKKYLTLPQSLQMRDVKSKKQSDKTIEAEPKEKQNMYLWLG